MKFKQKFFSIIAVLILYLTLFNSSCSEDNPVVPPPPPDKEQFVKLSTLTVTCTEAFIKVSVNDTLLPLNITLNRDDNPVFNFSLTKNDTTVIDTNLSPGSSYNYTAAAVINGEEWTGDKLQIQTLATTSHNFTWQTFTFGEPSAGSSVLYDVAIIDENNIWAVGEIYMNDSLGNPDPNAYNAVHWDGINWELKRILYGGGFWTIRTIFAFNENDIWFSAFVRYDGQNFIELPIPPILMGWSIKKIWGSSSNDLYIVGDGGNIAHYQNGNWSKIESGTTVLIRDIWGTIEPVSGVLKILATASGVNNYKILSLTAASANDTLEWQTNKSLAGIWLDGIRTYASGTEIWDNEKNSWQQLTSTGYFFTRVRGSKCNNIYGIGPDGIVHFNGSNWQIIKERPEDIVLIAGECSTNMVAATGFTSSGGVVGKAAILMGTQIN